MGSSAIVIVEDDRNVAELLGFMLSREGFDPKLIRDGRAAESYVAANEPAAAVVLDVMLPYRDGFDVAAAIRSDPRWKDVPIVILTARVLQEDMERGRVLGVTEYVTKPFHPQAIVALLKRLVAPAG